MTKMDYVAIAEAIKDTKEDFTSEEANEALKTLALNLSIVFKLDHTRFDKVKFMKACGVGG